MYHNGVEYIDYEDADEGSYITESDRCSNCGYFFQSEEEMSSFVVEESGVQPGTVHGPAVYWASGYVVCPSCQEHLPYETSSD